MIITGAINWVFSFIRNFRKKVLFKESRPLISVNKGHKVLIWILDGCSVQAFLDVVANNRNLRTFYEEGYFSQCVTIFPTITPASHSSPSTDCYPSKTRIPAFDWIEIKTDYTGKQTKECIRCMPDFKRFIQGASSSKFRKEFFKGLGEARAYSIVRHLMYAAMIIQLTCTPMALGSCYALIPAVLIDVFIVIRTILEDKTLQKELEGYVEYTKKTPYRLLPGVL